MLYRVFFLFLIALTSLSIVKAEIEGDSNEDIAPPTLDLLDLDNIRVHAHFEPDQPNENLIDLLPEDQDLVIKLGRQDLLAPKMVMLGMEKREIDAHVLRTYTPRYSTSSTIAALSRQTSPTPVSSSITISISPSTFIWPLPIPVSHFNSSIPEVKKYSSVTAQAKNALNQAQVNEPLVAKTTKTQQGSNTVIKSSQVRPATTTRTSQSTTASVNPSTTKSLSRPSRGSPTPVLRRIDMRTVSKHTSFTIEPTDILHKQAIKSSSSSTLHAQNAPLLATALLLSLFLCGAF